ncbi:hypothetical protein [Streptomyces sp. DH24]|uniref:hypothetical protein n=1 Tax=Streptomyces sp. DH24 TaxID=3040123 RepID=UPI002442A2E1|nr:hypothetical protein [Streptomyces sp. DH24]MDG9715260.1 hypothetical protein [Streptomyces sp. DH24]
MATGVLRPGAALALVLLFAGPVTGCGAAERAREGGAVRTGSAPAPRTTSPQDLCARIVGHWSREVLDGGTYGDYQSMGLSNGQYELLREVVDAARAEKRRGGARAAAALIERDVAAGCAELYRTGTPTGGPWQ